MDKGKMIVEEVNDNVRGSKSDDILGSIGETERSKKNDGEVQDGKVVKSKPPRKGRYHRHTPQQVHEMEKLFKEFPHPSDKQKRELSLEFGMKLSQVTFWFQNKRNKMKVQHEHQGNMQLRIDKEKLQAENVTLKEALSNAACATCGGSAIGIAETSNEEVRLKRDNDELRKEIDRLSGLVATYAGKPFSSP